jgi:hypothetical protein
LRDKEALTRYGTVGTGRRLGYLPVVDIHATETASVQKKISVEEFKREAKKKLPSFAHRETPTLSGANDEKRPTCWRLEV